MTRINSLSIVLALTFFLFSCSANKPASTVKAPDSHKKISELYCYIPAGIVHHSYNKNNDGWQRDTLKHFLISPTEVTNFQYKEFLYSLKDTPSRYRAMYPDTTVWTQKLAYGEPLMNHYFSHPAYRDYPVVGVSQHQAREYCEWLETALKATFPDNKFNAHLPTKEQFARAARDSFIRMYPHGGYLRNAKGQFLYNFKAVGDQRIAYSETSRRYQVKSTQEYSAILPSDGFLITTIAESYAPNKFGLYNISGNVAEWSDVSEIALGGSWNSPGYDIRIDSRIRSKSPTSNIGFRVVLEIVD